MGVNLSTMKWDGDASSLLAQYQMLAQAEQKLQKETGRTVKITEDASGKVVAAFGREIKAREAANKVVRETGKRIGHVSLAAKKNNLVMQQLTFGVQDLAAVYGTQGLAGGIRAANNNLQQAIAIMGIGGVWGLVLSLGTIALPALAEAFVKAGDAADDAAKKADESFQKAIDKIGELQKERRKFAIGQTRFDEEQAEADFREKSGLTAESVRQHSAQQNEITAKLADFAFRTFRGEEGRQAMLKFVERARRGEKAESLEKEISTFFELPSLSGPDKNIISSLKNIQAQEDAIRNAKDVNRNLRIERDAEIDRARRERDKLLQ